MRPRPASFMLAAFACGWNVIVRKQTLEDNNYNLRRVMNYPGTGPFRHVRRVDKEVWVMEKNRDYWNEGLPYLDGIEFYNFAGFSPELGAALLARRIDYGRLLDPVTLKKAQATPGMSGTDFYQSAIHAVTVNNAKKPFDDPRVRRAFHLVCNRPVLIEAVKDIAPMLIGGFIYPFSEFATPPAKLSERLGYQARPGGCHQRGQAAHGGGGLCQWPQGRRLVGQGRRLDQALGHGHPSHVQGNAERRGHVAHSASQRTGSMTRRPGGSTWRAARSSPP